MIYRIVISQRLRALHDPAARLGGKIGVKTLGLLRLGFRGRQLTSRWDDFDLERGVWVKPSHHTKQKRTEHLPLSSGAVNLLGSMAADHSEDNPHVFPGKKPGQPIKDLKSFWKSVTTAADLDDHRLHDNRHTHASHLVSSGHSLPVVGRLLGHTNPMTTQRYAHLADDPLREAAEVMGSKLTGRGRR